MTDIINLQNLALPTAVVIASAWIIVSGNVGTGFLFLLLGLAGHAALRGIEFAIAQELIKVRARNS